MLYENMYVRCPVTGEQNPRDFFCGRVLEARPDTVQVEILDPFDRLRHFPKLPREAVELLETEAEHCSLFVGSSVLYEDQPCRILSVQKARDGFFYYYIQRNWDRTVFHVCETELVASFDNGKVDPADQLKRYEFQNPCWYLGRTQLSRHQTLLENALFGFQELAGAKIKLFPHQMDTVMHGLQEDRLLLCDEVGLGKTVEALSMLKLCLRDERFSKVLILVPKALKRQWSREIFTKLGLDLGTGHEEYKLVLKEFSELQHRDLQEEWGLVIVDEVHRCLQNREYWTMLHTLSTRTRKLFLLSAPPVLQRPREYLELLQLLDPARYDGRDPERFSELLSRQDGIIRTTQDILQKTQVYAAKIAACQNAQEAFMDLKKTAAAFCQELRDPKMAELFRNIRYDQGDHGLTGVRTLLSYVSRNYRVEPRIICHRRKGLTLPQRSLETRAYVVQDPEDLEARIYSQLQEWVEKAFSKESMEQTVCPVLCSFFSSPWAFMAQLRKQMRHGVKIPQDLFQNGEKWLRLEHKILKHAPQILDNHDESQPESRLLTILKLLTTELSDRKVVLFTGFEDTFEAYKTALSKLFPQSEVAFCGKSISRASAEIERFQKSARILLCDSADEGNLQCADLALHVDLPWDASVIEQRIQRLDCLDRDPARPVVSMAVYAENTFEDALIRYWSQGIRIFDQSLGGMEFFMKEMTGEILTAIRENFSEGLFERLPKAVQLADDLRESVVREQAYDEAALLERPVYQAHKHLLEAYTENDRMAAQMTHWANLAGLHPVGDYHGAVTFSKKNTSEQAARNAGLVLPDWHGKQELTGTFQREKAVESENLHFFAPGDSLYDSILENALCSCKGQATAFAARSDLNWCGFIFHWSLAPNESVLLEHGLPLYALSPYRSFLLSEQIAVPVTVSNFDSYTDQEILDAYEQVLSKGFHRKDLVHLGQRGRNSTFLRNPMGGKSCVRWFRENYPQPRWQEMVTYARKIAQDKAFAVVRDRSNLAAARAEMERTLYSRKLHEKFYGMLHENRFGVPVSDLKPLREQQEILLEALRRPKVVLDSAAFVWLTKIE